MISSRISKKILTLCMLMLACWKFYEEDYGSGLIYALVFGLAVRTLDPEQAEIKIILVEEKQSDISLADAAEKVKFVIACMLALSKMTAYIGNLLYFTGSNYEALPEPPETLADIKAWRECSLLQNGDKIGIIARQGIFGPNYNFLIRARNQDQKVVATYSPGNLSNLTPLDSKGSSFVYRRFDSIGSANVICDKNFKTQSEIKGTDAHYYEVSPHGSYLIINRDNSLELYDIRDKKNPKAVAFPVPLDPNPDSVRSIAIRFTQDEKHFFVFKDIRNEKEFLKTHTTVELFHLSHHGKDLKLCRETVEGRKEFTDAEIQIRNNVLLSRSGYNGLDIQEKRNVHAFTLDEKHRPEKISTLYPADQEEMIDYFHLVPDRNELIVARDELLGSRMLDFWDFSNLKNIHMFYSQEFAIPRHMTSIAREQDESLRMCFYDGSELKVNPYALRKTLREAMPSFVEGLHGITLSYLFHPAKKPTSSLDEKNQIGLPAPPRPQ